MMKSLLFYHREGATQSCLAKDYFLTIEDALKKQLLGDGIIFIVVLIFLQDML